MKVTGYLTKIIFLKRLEQRSRRPYFFLFLHAPFCLHFLRSGFLCFSLHLRMTTYSIYMSVRHIELAISEFHFKIPESMCLIEPARISCTPLVQRTVIGRGCTTRSALWTVFRDKEYITVVFVYFSGEKIYNFY